MCSVSKYSRGTDISYLEFFDVKFNELAGVPLLGFPEEQEEVLMETLLLNLVENAEDIVSSDVLSIISII